MKSRNTATNNGLLFTLLLLIVSCKSRYGIGYPYHPSTEYTWRVDSVSSHANKHIDTIPSLTQIKDVEFYMIYLITSNHSDIITKMYKNILYSTFENHITTDWKVICYAPKGNIREINVRPLPSLNFRKGTGLC